jgi:hypothetical protein
MPTRETNCWCAIVGVGAARALKDVPKPRQVGRDGEDAEAGGVKGAVVGAAAEAAQDALGHGLGAHAVGRLGHAVFVRGVGEGAPVTDGLPGDAVALGAARVGVVDDIERRRGERGVVHLDAVAEDRRLPRAAAGVARDAPIAAAVLPPSEPQPTSPRPSTNTVHPSITRDVARRTLVIARGLSLGGIENRRTKTCAGDISHLGASRATPPAQHRRHTDEGQPRPCAPGAHTLRTHRTPPVFVVAARAHRRRRPAHFEGRGPPRGVKQPPQLRTAHVGAVFRRDGLDIVPRGAAIHQPRRDGHRRARRGGA